MNLGEFAIKLKHELFYDSARAVLTDTPVEPSCSCLACHMEFKLHLKDVMK